MVLKTQRGSQDGLRKSKELLKIKNTELMWEVIIRLRKEKGNDLWSYKDVWSGAGLKSAVALNSPWNSHVKGAIDSHNSALAERLESGALAQSQRKTLRSAIRELRAQLDVMKAQRDEALGKIAFFEAEAGFFKKECETQLAVIDRLRSKLRDLRSV
jgi:chromosome segregation ATPase